MNFITPSDFFGTSFKDTSLSLFKLYSYFYYKYTEKKQQKFYFLEILEDTMLSRNSIYKYSKKLSKMNLIDIDITLERDYKVYNVKLKNYTKEEKSRLFKRRTSIYNNKDKDTKEINKYNKIIKWAEFIVKRLQKHTHYRNEYFDRLFARKLNNLSEKEIDNIKYIIKKIGKEWISKYIKWWVVKKAKAFRGFSFGALAIQDIIEEFRVNKMNKQDPIKKSQKTQREKETKNKNKKLMIDYLKSINLKKPNDDDKEIIQEALGMNLIKKSKIGYNLIGA